MQFVLCSSCFTPSQEGAIICPNCGANIQDLPYVGGDQLEGAVFEDRYQLDSYLDEGAMAWVYKGLHMELGSSVAIKILKPSFQTNDRFLARFKKEAMAASSLNHPNILSVITSGTTPSRITYIISEFIRGVSLGKLIQNESKLSLDRTIRIVGQILSALDEAHAKGIIHRDLKPENVMVTTLRSGEDFIKIVDFGIAKESHSDAPRITQNGELFGTPEYMAPEVIRGKEATHLSDLYAIGVLTYELLTGELPFAGEVIFDILKAHLEETPKSLTSLDNTIPLGIDTLISRTLAKDPQERPQSAIELNKLLQDHFNQSKGFTTCASCNFLMENSHKFCPNCGTNAHTTTKDMTPVGSLLNPTEEGGVPPAKATLDGEPQELGPTTSQVSQTLSRILFNEDTLEPRFLGRERECDLITSFLYSDRIVLELNGPKGIGKTTLAKHILTSQINERIASFFTTADPTFVSRPWYPIRKIFKQIMHLDGDPTKKEILHALDAIQLEPDDIPYILKIMGIERTNIVERKVVFREIIASALRLILAVCIDQPSLLLFDDIDEYDFPSRFFIDHLISTIQEFPIKVIVTSEGPLLEKTALSDTIILTRLDPEEISPHLFQLGNRSTRSWQKMVDGLLSSSMGLPLHVSEGAHLLLEGGDEVSSNLIDLMSLRVQRLPAMGIKILQLVSLYGCEAPLELISEYLEHNPLIANTLEVLVKRGYITREDPLTIRLTHPLLTEIVPAMMTGIVKAEYHDYIFRFLKRRDGSVYHMARHILKSNNLEEAGIYLEQAGDAYEQELDDYSACTYYRHAYDIAKLHSLRGDQIDQFTRISIKLGDILRYTNQFVEAESVLKEGLLFSEGDPDVEAIILSSLARLSLLSSESGQEKATSLINRAAKLATKSSNRHIFYRVFFDLSSIAGERGSFGAGAEKLRWCLSKASELFSMEPQFWRLFLKLAEFEFHTGNQDEAVRILMDGLAILGEREEEFPLAKGRIHFLLGQFFSYQQRQYDAIPHLELASTYLQSVGDRKTAAEASLIIAENNHNVKENLKRATFLSMQIGWRQGLEKAKLLSSDLTE